MIALPDIVFAIPAISMLLGAAGVIRFRSFMMKMQAATMIHVGGVMLSLLLFSMYAPSPQLRLKTLFLLILTFLTTPVSSHLIARCYYQLNIIEGKKRRR